MTHVIDDGPVTLHIAPEKVCFLIIKAREFATKQAVSISDIGSNASDDGMIEVLEDRGDDPVAAEIKGWLAAMDVDEHNELVALMRLGRGDAGIEDLDMLRAEAADEGDRNTFHYLLGTPLLAEFLDEGLSLTGHDCQELDEAHL